MQGKALAKIPSSIQAIKGGVSWPCFWNGGFYLFLVVLVDPSKACQSETIVILKDRQIHKQASLV
jgi:hypothetical protein